MTMPGFWKHPSPEEVVVSSKPCRVVIALLLPAFLFLGSSPTLAQARISVVEYYHAAFDHYFVTAIAAACRILLLFASRRCATVEQFT